MLTRFVLVALLAPAIALGPLAQNTKPPAAAAGSSQPLPPGRIEQLVAPIALHPDDLVSQLLMASTYPLEVVQAKRWLDQNKSLKGDALAKALEAQPWDPSVKSLCDFPQILEMMDKKLDWMQQLGNDFLAQKNDVMTAIQALRKKAQETGNLKSSKEQTVTQDGEVITIDSADPDVVYVPVYNPTVVYGGWPYPAYPPYYYYPPGYAPGAGYGFAVGISIGLAWGYAWGHCDWHHDDIDIDIDRNVERNRNINRENYKNKMATRDASGARTGKGSFQHDPTHRQGVAYGDRATAKKFGQGQSPSAGTREAFRGRADAGAAQRPAGGANRSTPAAKPAQRPASSGSGFGEVKRGSEVKRESSRGRSSRSSYQSRAGGVSRGGGARGGARGGRR